MQYFAYINIKCDYNKGDRLLSIWYVLTKIYFCGVNRGRCDNMVRFCVS